MTGRLLLLGTKGGPSLRPNLVLPSCNALVGEAGVVVVDAGYGASLRLVQAGLGLTDITDVFITHLHSDHVLDLGPLLYNAWVNGLARPVRVHGPPGLRAVIDGFLAALAYDIDIRIADEGRPDLRGLVALRALDPGTPVDVPGWTVTCIEVPHPPVVPSFALRFDRPGRAVVFSGDTAFHPPLAEFARGADLLVHEVMHGPAVAGLLARNPRAARLEAHLRASHTLAADVGRIAAGAGVGTLVLNHFVPGDDPALTPAVWEAAVRETFAGRIVVGADRMEFPL